MNLRPKSHATTIVISAGVGALVAAVLSFVLVPQIVSARPSASDDPSDFALQLDDIEKRLLALEERPVPVSLALSKPVERIPVTRSDTAALGRLAQRLARLEAQLIEKVTQPKPEHRQIRPMDTVSLANRVRENQQRILDPRLSEQEKLQAWKKLRHLGKDAWNELIVYEMSRIGLTSKDPALRADVWRQADARARSPALVPALLNALANDSVADVREEAAETLENYSSDPSVMQALELAKRNDPDTKVRRYAARSLERGQRERERKRKRKRKR